MCIQGILVTYVVLHSKAICTQRPQYSQKCPKMSLWLSFNRHPIKYVIFHSTASISIPTTYYSCPTSIQHPHILLLFVLALMHWGHMVPPYTLVPTPPVGYSVCRHKYKMGFLAYYFATILFPILIYDFTACIPAAMSISSEFRYSNRQ